MCGIGDEEAAGLLAKPLGDAGVASGALEGGDTVEGVGRTTAGGPAVWFGPFVDRREGQAQLGSHLFGT